MTQQDKPPLPSGEFEFCPATREWYDAWRQSSISDAWDARHWQYMFDTAIVHSAVYGSFDFSMLSELDRRERYMGLTFPRDAPAEPTKTEVTVLQLVKEDRAKRHAEAANRD